jgi:cell wall-associated NlpC family hydrolase
MSRSVLRPVLPAAVLAVLLSLLVTLVGVRPARAEDPPPAPLATELRISAPATVAAGSHASVFARLVDAAGGVEGATVLIQRQAPTGWSPVGTLTTGSGGLGSVGVAIGSTYRYRAFFRGDSLHETATSREIVIAASSTLAQRALAEVRRHKGAPYQWAATGPSRFDCSGLTMYVFRRLGRSLPHSSAQQARVTHRIANSAKRPGDLIFIYHGSTVGHVGIYAGGSQIWAAVKAGDVVRLQSFSGRRYVVGRVS